MTRFGRDGSEWVGDPDNLPVTRLQRVRRRLGRQAREAVSDADRLRPAPRDALQAARHNPSVVDGTVSLVLLNSGQDWEQFYAGYGKEDRFRAQEVRAVELSDFLIDTYAVVKEAAEVKADFVEVLVGAGL